MLGRRSTIRKFTTPVDCLRASPISNNFKGAIVEYKVVLHCEAFDYEEFLYENMNAPLSEPFFTRRIKMLSTPDAFLLYCTMSFGLFSFSYLLYPFMKIRLRLVITRLHVYMINDNPNVGLGIVDCSRYTSFALKDDYHRKRMDMLVFTMEFGYLESPAKTHTSCMRKPVFCQKTF